MSDSSPLLQASNLGLTLDHMHLTLDPERGVARLTFDRPDVMNIISIIMRSQIAEVFRVLERDSRARVVVMTGAGGQFTSGGDIPLFMQTDSATLSLLHHNVAAAERYPYPVVAAIDGYCLGVGLEIALACDFRVATTRAQFGAPEINLGMIPGSGGSQRLIRLVGMTRAKDLVMRGRRITAADALQWGLITEVAEPQELEAAIDGLSNELLTKPRLAIRTAKRVMNLGQDAPLATALQLEGYAYGMLSGTEDFAEGVAAFAERRRPRFRES